MRRGEKIKRKTYQHVDGQHKRMDKYIDERGGDCGSGQEQLEDGYSSQRLQDTALNDDDDDSYHMHKRKRQPSSLQTFS